jgi:hypothetical protein
MSILRRNDWIDGQFEVTSVEVLDVSDGVHTLRVAGRLVLPDGNHGAIVTTTRTQRVGDPPVQELLQVPARWRRDRPDTHRIDWSAHGGWAALAARERAARAAALGIDPGTLQPDSTVPDGMAPRDAALYWSTNAAPLPDGIDPVQVPEADGLKRTGEAAEATVLAIDFLRAWPGTLPDRHASVANVALRVDRRDGSTYRAIARFGFRTPERRRQIGHVGARVPVRLDPSRPERVVIDSDRLHAPDHR